MTATVGHARGIPNDIELLWDYANEMGIKIEKTADPTKMADELFNKSEGDGMTARISEVIHGWLGLVSECTSTGTN